MSVVRCLPPSTVHICLSHNLDLIRWHGDGLLLRKPNRRERLRQYGSVFRPRYRASDPFKRVYPPFYMSARIHGTQLAKCEAPGITTGAGAGSWLDADALHCTPLWQILQRSSTAPHKVPDRWVWLLSPSSEGGRNQNICCSHHCDEIYFKLRQKQKAALGNRQYH